MLIWIFCITIIKGATGLPEYHQDDYDVKFERANIVWYNHLYAKDVYLNFPFYNRTQRLINGSIYLLQDMTSTDLVGEMQWYKFLSNEYRHFPLRLGANLCTEYAKNNFNVKEILKNTSNIYPCPLKKGLYYIRNAMPDASTFPPFIPRGRYKSVGKLFLNKDFVAEGETYIEIKDKPLKWWKF